MNGVRGIYTVPVAGGDPTRLADIADDANTAMAWAPDGVTLAVQGTVTGRVEILRTDTAQRTVVAPGGMVES